MSRLRPGGIRRGGRGFTLLELVLVAAVSSVLFAMLIRWVLTLSAAGSASLAGAGAHRGADVSAAAFATDITAASACAVGAVGPVVDAEPDSVTFWTRGSDGSLSEVHWALSGGVLTRTLTAHLAADVDPCSAGGASSAQTVATGLTDVDVAAARNGDPAAHPAFSTVTDGGPVTDPLQAYGDCAPATDGSYAARCRAQAISVHWSFQVSTDRAGSSAPVVLTRTFTFPSNNQGIS